VATREEEQRGRVRDGGQKDLTLVSQSPGIQSLLGWGRAEVTLTGGEPKIRKLSNDHILQSDLTDGKSFSLLKQICF
jgi:hypothetical protein